MEGDKAKADRLVLLNSFVSPFGNRARIALARKGDGAKNTLLLSSNPVHGKVLVLIVGGKPVRGMRKH